MKILSFNLSKYIYRLRFIFYTLISKQIFRYSNIVDKFQIFDKIKDLTNKRDRKKIKGYVKISTTMKISFLAEQIARRKEIRTKISILRHLFRLHLTGQEILIEESRWARFRIIYRYSRLQ